MKKLQEVKNHGKPITRREFLAAGLIEAAGVMMAPTLFDMFFRSNNAYAAAGDLPGFMVLDLAGGIAFPRNFLVGKNAPDDRLKSYFTLGLGTTASANIAVNRDYGLPMPSTSPFLAGFLETCSAAARAKVRFGSFCHKSTDDTTTNRHSALVLVSELCKGNQIPLGVGARPSSSGGYSGTPNAVSSLRPLVIESSDSLGAALKIQGPLGSAPSQQAWAKAVRSLIEAQGARYNNRLGGKEFIERLKESADQNVSVASQSLGLDVRQDAACQAIFGITPATAKNDPAVIRATIAFAAVKRISGPGCLFRGGYDYHVSGFDESVTDLERDKEAGREAGRVFELAHRSGVPVMIQMLTDGGTVFGNTASGYRGFTDSGDRSLTVLGVYDPAGPRPQPRLQVGSYTDGEVASIKSIIGTDESKVAYAVLANYLNVIGRLGEFSRYGANIFSASELDQVLLFG